MMFQEINTGGCRPDEVIAWQNVNPRTAEERGGRRPTIRLAISPIVLAATVAAAALGNTAMAAPGAAMPAAGLSRAVALGSAMKFVQDPSGPKVRLANGEEFQLMPLPDELKRKLEANAAHPRAMAAA